MATLQELLNAQSAVADRSRAKDWSARNRAAFGGLLGINEFFPVTGDIQSGILAAQDLGQGAYGSAALNALGLLPFVPAMGGVVKKASKAAMKAPVSGKITAYHGTDELFDKFDFSKYGKTDEGFAGQGVYFTNDIPIAQEYGKNLVKANFDLKNPLVVNDYDEITNLLGVSNKRDLSKKSSMKITNELKNLGYDGVVVKDYRDTGEPVFEYVVFDPEKIKIIK